MCLKPNDSQYWFTQDGSLFFASVNNESSPQLSKRSADSTGRSPRLGMNSKDVEALCDINRLAASDTRCHEFVAFCLAIFGTDLAISFQLDINQWLWLVPDDAHDSCLFERLSLACLVSVVPKVYETNTGRVFCGWILGAQYLDKT